MIGLDWSGADIDPADAYREGARFALRYSAGVGNSHPDTQWKLCKPNEIEQNVAAGLDFFANSEWYADRITEGADAGRADGIADLAFWKSRKLNRGATIYVSWDTYPDPEFYDEVDDYLNAYGDAVAPYYDPEPGLYAGSRAIRKMIANDTIDYGWQTMSTSWSDDNLAYQPDADQIKAAVANPPSGITIWQNGNYWYGNGADENVLLRSTHGSHLSVLEDRPSKPAKPHRPRKAHPKPTPIGGGYVVRPSDSDGLIAVCRRHGVRDWRQVAKLNHLVSPYVIRPGDVIRWPGGTNLPAPVRKVQYTVQPGDSLFRIASRWGVSLRALEKANPRAGHPAGNFNKILPGDIIKHP